MLSRRATAPVLVLAAVAVVLALLVALVPSSARADDAAPADGTGQESTDSVGGSVGAGVDTQQPDTAVRVLPAQCLKGTDVMPKDGGLCRVTRFGATRPTVVVWGDSHSWQQTRAMTAMARKTRTNLITFQMGACPPMDLTGTSYRTACATNAKLALDFIKQKVRRGERRTLTVVLGAFWHLYHDYAARTARGWVPDTVQDAHLVQEAELFHVGGERLFRTLDRLKVRTAGIGQMPWISPSAPVCETDTPTSTSYGCDLPRATAIEDEAATARWLRARTDIYVDATPYVCDATTCHATTGGRATFLDKLHLNPAVSDAFAPAYRRVFRAA